MYSEVVKNRFEERKLERPNGIAEKMLCCWKRVK
jgi:hypothetical protein